MTESEKIKFEERKRRSLTILSKEFQNLARQTFPKQEVFENIREQLTYLERLHSSIGRKFASAEEKFWKYYNLEEFCKTNDWSIEHMRKCKTGQRPYSPMLMQAIINFIEKETA